MLGVSCDKRQRAKDKSRVTVRFPLKITKIKDRKSCLWFSCMYVYHVYNVYQHTFVLKSLPFPSNPTPPPLTYTPLKKFQTDLRLGLKLTNQPFSRRKVHVEMAQNLTRRKVQIVIKGKRRGDIIFLQLSSFRTM